MPPRKGVTLIEVLAAIFITGVGLLALLTLFPLGAIEMAQAIQDDRTGHIARTADSIARIRWTAQGFDLRTDPRVVNAMDDPAGNTGTTPSGSDPSYPVFVDPIGYNLFASNAAWQQWLGGRQANQAGSMRRETVSFLEDTAIDTNLTNVAYKSQQLRRWMTFMDDITFPREVNDLGVPSNPVDRANRYSWAYVAQRVRMGAERPVHLYAVVYSGRPLSLSGNPSGEDAYTASLDPTANTVTLTLTGTAPDLREGAWILDSTITTTPRFITRGSFHRVVSIDRSDATQMVLQVQPPLRDYTNVEPNGTVYILENVVEVFDLGS